MITQKQAIKDDMLRTIVQVARLYYESDMSQQAIADKLGVSRSLIAKYLLQSKEQGIVRIRVVDPSESSEELAEQIRQRFGLQHVEVLPHAHASEELTLHGVAYAAAQYFTSHVQKGDKVGLAWGRSVKGIVDQLPALQVDVKDIEVVPLLGESSNPRLYSRMNELVEQMANTVAALPRYLFYPMTVGTKSLRTRIIKETAFTEVSRLWDQLDWAFIGIGSNPPTEGMAVYVDDRCLASLNKTGAIGDICCRYFDDDGRFVKTAFGDQIIGIDADQLKSTKNLVAVAAGSAKASAVRGALKTGLIDALFIDQPLATSILEGRE